MGLCGWLELIAVTQAPCQQHGCLWLVSGIFFNVFECCLVICVGC